MSSSVLLPIFLVLLFGFVLNRSFITNNTVWLELERLTYYVFFPCLLLLRLSQSSFSVADLMQISLVILLALGAITLIIFLLRKGQLVSSGSLSSVYQGSIRFNTYIGLACIDGLYGDYGLALAAMCLAIFIPAVNVLSVLCFSFNGGSSTNQGSKLLGTLAGNPLVLACVAGLIIGFSSWDYPAWIESLLGILSQPALPLGLLAVGAGIRFMSMQSQGREIAVAVLGKFLFMPGCMWLVVGFLNVETNLAVVLIIIAALPTAPSAFILSRQLGGNVSLMANIISVQTLLAFLLIPIWISLAGNL